MSSLVKQVSPNELQKRRLLSFLSCESSDPLYTNLIDWLSKLNFQLEDFKKTEIKKPFEVLEDYERLAMTASKLINQLDGLQADHGLFDQVFKLNKLELESSTESEMNYTKKSGIRELYNNLNALVIASNDMRHEIKPSSSKKPIEATTVLKIVEFADLNSLPTGKSNTRFHEFLAVVFEILNIEHGGSFERLIRKAKQGDI